ncbi:Heat shock protein 42 [Penicillium vulpinum]|uniref:SHSP domain-containing protein n=1 Tax=Penicillium vulpinum TaxID=29845 RepID=A0A1V6S0P6_9EURO|nr:Heat shock protein 42 [Penicillium vulpinum]KAJ5960042.1 Heat shock protein 42 [Penicillium vulpinum]OQE07595.1 hypothetical protein PENVUL_c013G04868 [Penicillium vulpinum]
MALRNLNQYFPSWGSNNNAEDQGPSHHFFSPRGEADHPYPNPWPSQSGNGRGGRPNNPYPPQWAQPGDEGEGNNANNEAGDTSRKPYPYPGHNQQYQGPPWYQPQAYPGPADGRKPYSASWDDDKPKSSSRKPYPYPGPGDSHKSKPSYARQPYEYPGDPQSAGQRYPDNPQGPFHGGQNSGPGKGQWGGYGSYGGFGRGGNEPPQASQDREEPSQQEPKKSPAPASEKFRPEVDLFDAPEAFVIHVPLPGAQKEDIEINYDPKTVELSVTGVINRPGGEDLIKSIALDERKVGAFERKVRLGSRANPPKIDADAITAKLEEGILIVEVPKTEADDVEIRKVEIE